MTTDALQQFPSTQQKLGARRASILLVAHGKSFINQYAAQTDSSDEFRQEWAVQIVSDNDSRKLLTLKWPGSHLDISLDYAYRRRRGVNATRVAIDRVYVMPPSGQEKRMSPVTASHIEYAPANRNYWSEAHHPRRRCEFSLVGFASVSHGAIISEALR